MINGIHHTSMTTVDLDRMVEFYTQSLGFEVAWMSAGLSLGKESGPVRLAMLRSGTSFVRALQRTDYDGPSPYLETLLGTPGYKDIAFDVTDIEAEYDRLSAAGMKFLLPPTAFDEAGIVMAYLEDPDGNLVQLVEVVDESSPLRLSRMARQGSGNGAINGLHHTNLTATNLDRMVDFYTTVLGLEIAWDARVPPRPGEPPLHFAFFRAGASFVEAAQRTDMAGPPIPDLQQMLSTPGYKHFCLDMKNIDSEFERLAAGGMKFIFPPMRRPEASFGGTFGYDPDGNLIELMEVFDEDGIIHISRARQSTAAA